MAEPTHDELREMIAPYVLGAVDEEERTVVRAHILSCEECMQTADRYSEVGTWLDNSVDPIEPPAGFADRVLAAARDSDAPARLAEVIPLRRPPRWQWLAAAAMLVAIAVLGFSLVSTRNDLQFQERVVRALVREEGMTLQGDGAVAKMIPTSEGGIFVASGMQPAPDNHTYQLWVIEGEQPISAGVFEADNGVVAVDIETSLQDAEAVAVTIEPDGGSPEPTSDPIMTSG